MRDYLVEKKALFGTGPVFLTAISTILGAVMFLRFGYAVGNVSFLGVLPIIIIGHCVTIPTAMAIAEISTNQKVEGGGEYFIISRSFGLNIGASIGIALYLSQAISVAFYVIAFAQAFDPVIEYISSAYGILIYDKRLISIPALALLTLLMLTKGANLGVKTLYIVVGTLFVSLVMFFAGNSGEPFTYSMLTDHVENPDDFFYVFAICFPAFTGMTAGVGLSGDLKDPKKSIPMGTLGATIIGMVIYLFVAYKLAVSANSEHLANDQLVMSNIALWGPIIPIGLAAATISSAIGSFMVAPRTLQALGGDQILPVQRASNWLKKGTEKNNEPFNASIVTAAIALIFVAAGDVNIVAGIISMFFMVTYGALCSISFLQHFAADPSYRPVFRSKWYISLLGALFSFWLMFKMNPVFAILAIAIMVGLYLMIGYFKPESRGLTNIFQGVIFQTSRKMQVFLQKASGSGIKQNWRPSIVCFSQEPFKRFAAFDLLRWVSQRYGFGTFIYYMNGYFSRESYQQAKEAQVRLINLAEISKSNIYIDTLISPSYTSAIAQIIQLPGISGKENNMIMFDFDKSRIEELEELVDNYQLIKVADFDICILGHSSKGFGYRNEIHVWIESKDFHNANLMILLAYIISGHRDWKDSHIKIFAAFPVEEIIHQRKKLMDLISTGRLPISPSNIRIIEHKDDTDFKAIINKTSLDSDLTIVGFRGEQLKNNQLNTFAEFDEIGNILFVNSSHQKEIH